MVFILHYLGKSLLPLRAFATTSVAESKPTASMVLYGKKAIMLAGFTPSLVGQWYGSLIRLRHTAIQFDN